jgi:hypothetical protein
VSTAYDHGSYPPPDYPPARLTGVLARSRVSTFEPLVAGSRDPEDPAGPVRIPLIKVAYQPLEKWPELDPGEKNRAKVSAAENYICTRLDGCKTDKDGMPAKDSCPDVRSCYWKKPTESWDKKYSVLVAAAYPGPNSRFDEKTFAAVKGELLPEVKEVGDVQDYINGLQLPFGTAVVQSYVNLTKIGDNIKGYLNPPAASNATSSTLELISKFVALGKAAGSTAGQGAGGLSAAFALAAFLSDQQGQPIIGGEITAKTDQLSQQLFERFNLASTELYGLYELIVSDYGKLEETNNHIHSDWSLPLPTETAKVLTTAASQSFYEALVPVAYPYLIRANGSNARTLDCGKTLPAQDAWPNQPDGDQLYATVGYDGNARPIKAIFFFTRGIFGGSSPPGDLADKMFAPETVQPPAPSSGLAIEKLSFFTPRIFGGRIIHAINGTFRCSVAWLPQLP